MDCEPPKPPENPEKCVGIDVGILKYAHDTDGMAVGSLDLSDERERLKREQRKLSRKQHGSNNYEKQRRRVGSVTPTSDGSAATSCTSSRTTTRESTTSWLSKT